MANRDVFLSALSTFIREPTLDWKKWAERASKVDRRTYAQQKIDIVMDKLEGGHPIKIAQVELSHGQPPSKYRHKVYKTNTLVSLYIPESAINV